MADYSKTYTPTSWVNDGEPALNATNMLNIEDYISELDDRTKDLQSEKMGKDSYIVQRAEKYAEAAEASAEEAAGEATKAATSATASASSAASAAASAEAAAKTDVGKLTTKVEDMDASGKMLGWTLPVSLQGKNYIDAEGVFHQTIARVDLGSLTWTATEAQTSTKLRMTSTSIASVAKAVDNGTVATIFCSKYDAKTATQTWLYNEGISIDKISRILIYDANYDTSSSTTAFASAMSGVYLYYELAEEITTQVDGNELLQTLSDTVGTVNEALNSLYE